MADGAHPVPFLPGKALEALVADIQKSLHHSAVITTNEKIADVDSGELRQVDICIRLKDGPTEFLGIVEVRDQGRAVGSPYVEQVISKRASTRADAAFIVSRAGFTKPALAKCNKHGIRAMILSEATAAAWSQWLGTRHMSHFERRYEATQLALGYPGTETGIELAEAVQVAYKSNPKAAVLTDADGVAIASLTDLIDSVVQRFAEQVYPNIADGGTRAFHRLLVPEHLVPPLFVETNDGKRQRIGAIAVLASFWWEETRYPISLLRFSSQAADSLAEVAQAEIKVGDRRHRVEMIAPGAGQVVPANTEITLRVTDLGPWVLGQTVVNAAEGVARGGRSGRRPKRAKRV